MEDFGCGVTRPQGFSPLTDLVSTTSQTQDTLTQRHIKSFEQTKEFLKGHGISTARA
jgi:hypothetical protein